MEARDAVIADLPVIVKIYNGTIASRMVTADIEPVSVESRRAWFEQHSPARRPLWVVLEGSIVIGWLSYSSFYGRPAYDRTCEISMYLAPEYQRRGLGSTLLRRSIEHAPAIGVTTLLGFIFAHNTPSLRLVEKHGFTRWGYLPRVAILDGVERDVAILGRHVGSLTHLDGPHRG
jgi:L-amino acid N-acyltransferase YncA